MFSGFLAVCGGSVAVFVEKNLATLYVTITLITVIIVVINIKNNFGAIPKLIIRNQTNTNTKTPTHKKSN